MKVYSFFRECTAPAKFVSMTDLVTFPSLIINTSKYCDEHIVSFAHYYFPPCSFTLTEPYLETKTLVC